MPPPQALTLASACTGWTLSMRQPGGTAVNQPYTPTGARGNQIYRLVHAQTLERSTHGGGMMLNAGLDLPIFVKSKIR